jgi:hypothetical protein
MESKFVKSEVSSYFEEFIINKFYEIRQVRTRSKREVSSGNSKDKNLGTKREVIYVEKCLDSHMPYGCYLCLI